MKAHVFLVLASLLGTGSTVYADEAAEFDPDFHFIFFACRITGSSLGEPSDKNDGFIDMKTKSHHTACERVGKKKLSCLTVFEEKDAKPVYYDMVITTEASQLLMIESANAGDFLVVRPESGRVVSTTRLVGEMSLATKLCHGIYLTGDEFKAMEAKRKKANRRGTD